MGYFLAGTLNVIPGFGTGYLALGRRKAFKNSLSAGLAMVVGAAIIGVAGPQHCLFSYPPICTSRIEMGLSGAISGGVLAILVINIPTAFHLWISWLISPFKHPPERV